MIGPSVVISSTDHEFGGLSTPMAHQGLRRSAVRIADDVWIGANAVVVAGVSIGRGAVVAAGAVVTGDVAEFDVVGGVPARPIKSRGPIASIRP
jgi:acetyltransferase-like isoleucine patch superfamily enzyme